MLSGMTATADAVDGIKNHIGHLSREGRLLAAAAQRAGLDARVPACDGWQVRDLLRHLGYVHRWAAMYVTEGHTEWVDRWSEQEILAQGPPDGGLLDWFRQGHGALVNALSAADPSMTCWTFLEAPSPLAFWARRQAHETAIHRVDAEQAAAGLSAEAVRGQVPAAAWLTEPMPADLAADGIDELLMGFLGRDFKRGDWDGPEGTFAFRAGDGAGTTACWRVEAGAAHGAVTRADAPADCVVTGPAADVYLLLWNRRPAAGLDVSGSAELLAEFRAEFAITWS
jgi:uncharacterized protein (TIGR03083 family)